MKTVIARFTELKENIAGTADSAFEDLDYNKVDIALKSVGVSLKDTNGQFRDLDDVFLELSGKWNSLDRNAQRYIATIAAGSRQQSRFIAMMENNERTMELVETAYDSAGRASEQFAKYQDTIEYKINKLANSWEQLRVSFLNSNTYGVAIETLTELLNKLKDFELIDFTALTTVWLTFGKSAIQSFIKGIQEGASVLQKVMSTAIINVKDNIMKKLGGTGGLNIRIDTQENEINELQRRIEQARRDIENNSIEIDVDTERAINEFNRFKDEYNRFYQEARINGFSTQEAEDWASANMGENFDKDLYLRGRDAAHSVRRAQAAQQNLDEYTARQAEFALSNDELYAATQVRGQILGQTLATAISIGLTSAMTEDNPMDAIGQVMLTGVASLGTSLISGISAVGKGARLAFIAETAGIGAIILGITAALTGLTVLIKKSLDEQEAQKFENRFKAAKERAEELEEAANSAANAVKNIKEQLNNTISLKDRFTELNEKQIKTNEEQEEYNKLVEQIQEEFPQIVSYYNEITGELRVQNDLWESIIEKQREQLAQEAKENFLASSAFIAAEKEVNRYKLAEEYSNRTGLSVKKVESLIENNFNVDELIESIEDSLSRTYNYVPSFNETIGHPSSLNDYDKFKALGLDVEKIANLYGQEVPYGLGDNKTYNELQNRILENTDILEEALNGLKKTIEEESNRQLKELTSNFKTLLTYIDPDAGAAELRLKEVIAQSYLESESLTVMTTTEYSKKNSGSGSFFNRLGGAKAGPSDNEFSDWENLNDDDTINGLDNYGIEDVEDVKKFFKAAYENETEAMLAWSELKTDAGGQAKIFDTVINQAILEKMEQAAQGIELSEIQTEQLEKLYSEALESGTTKEELNNLEVFLNNVGITSDAKARFVNELQSAWDEAARKIENFGVSDAQYKDWSTDQMNQYSSMIEELSEKIGEESAKAYGLDSLRIFEKLGLTPEQIMSAFSAVDWEAVTVGNISGQKNNFINTMQEILGDSFNTDEINKLWSNFFEIADKYNTIDLSITSEAGLEGVKTTLTETISKTIEGFSDISDVITEQLSEGFISFTSSQSVEAAIAEMGLKASNYLAYNNDGKINLDIEKLRKDVLESETFNAEQMLKKAREETKEKIQELKTRKAILLAGQGELDVAKNIVESNKINLQLLTQQYSLMASMYDHIEFDDSIVKGTNELLEIIDNRTENIDTAAVEEIQSIIDTYEAFLDNELIEGSDAWEEFIGKIEAGELQINNIIDEATKAAEEDISKLADAEKELAEAQKELNEALYGTSTFKNALDNLYNYDTFIERINKDLDETIEKLENISITDNPEKLISDLKSLVNQDVLYRTAENKIIEDSIKNYENVLSQNFSEYYKVIDGIYTFDESVLTAPINDNLKEYVLETIQSLNELKTKQDENLTAIEDRREEFNKLQEETLNDYVELQDNVVDILKSAYEEEIKATEDKYAALEEADNEYIDALEDAINKQRELRERENEYDELATKEKKLALMQRDTSGSREKERLKLEKEVEESRQNLVDSEVDRIINSLRELYELQKETRDAEIEYQQAMLDNAALMNEANLIIKSWGSFEDMFAWFLENNAELEGASIEKIEQYQNELEDMYAKKDLYAQLSEETFDSFLINSEEKVSSIISQIGQSLTTEADRSFTEIRNTVNEEIKAAQEAFSNAQKNIEEIQKKIENSITEIGNTAVETAKTTVQRAETGIEKTERLKVMTSDAESTYRKGGLKDDFIKKWEKYSDDAARLFDKAKFNDFKKYIKGGLVDYTGPAWVDGTPEDPEGFLNAKDTKRIGDAAELLSDLPIFNNTANAQNAVSTSIGDTSIEIHINVEQISDDYDVDQMIERVKQDIVDVTQPTGSAVIVNK